MIGIWSCLVSVLVLVIRMWRSFSFFIMCVIIVFICDAFDMFVVMVMAQCLCCRIFFIIVGRLGKVVFVCGLSIRSFIVMSALSLVKRSAMVRPMFCLLLVPVISATLFFSAFMVSGLLGSVLF